MKQKQKTKLFKEKYTVLKVIALTFWAICQGKLLAGINHIVIKVFLTILPSKN